MEQEVRTKLVVEGGEKAKKQVKDYNQAIEENTSDQKKNSKALDENTNAQNKNNDSKNKGAKANNDLGNVIKNISSKLTLQNLKNMANGIRSIASKTIELTKFSVDYIENLNLMDVAFADNSQSARKWVNNIAEIYGFDESNLAKQLGTFRQFGAALGFAGDKADMLSKNLTLMAGDISSLYNISFSQASEKLTSALTGQTKAIRSLGSDITQASLQQELYRLGINESISDMNRAEKTLLIYISLERQLANAQGDLAKTLESPSNQMKVFTEQVHRLARAIGNSLLPIMAKILPVVNGILMALTELFNFIASLLGYKQEDFDFGGALVDIDDLSGGFDGVSDSAGKAGKSVDNLKKKLTGLRGFDKLNVITTPADTKSSSGTGGSGSGIGGVAGGGINSKLLDSLKEYNAHLKEAGKKAQKIRDDILKWLGFTRDANGEWKLTNVTWGNMLVSAIGILTAFRLIKGIGKLLGLGSIGKGMIKVFGKLAGLSGGAGGAAATAGSGSIAGGLWWAVAAAATLVGSIATGATQANAFFKAADNARAGVSTQLTTWEKIASVVANTILPALQWIQLAAFGISKSMKKIDIFEGVSDETKEKLEPLYDELEIFDKKMANLDLSDRIVNIKDIGVIKERMKNISKIIVDELDADKNEQLKRVEGLKTVLGAKDYKDIVNSTKKYYDNRKKTVEDNEKKINDIVSKASKAKRALTENEISTINKLRNQNEKIGLNAATKNEQELERIYLRAKYNRENISVREASNIIKTSKKKYEAVVKDAEKTRKETIDEANKMREAGIITEDQYDKIVKAADKTKEDTIKKAKDQYDGILKKTQKGLGDNAKYIDEKTGEIKSNWSVWWDDLKKKTGNGMISIKAKISEKWYDIKKWWNEKVAPFFTKKYWQEKWDNIKTKVGDGVNSVKLKLQEKWKTIKTWLDNNVLKYFKRDYWIQKWNNIKDVIDLVLHPEKNLKTGTKGGSAVGIGGKIGGKAEGGFVDSGQLFVAREAGPELVGRIGSKTAVANNDQIVQAVSIGVQNAIARSGIGNARVVIEATGDSSGLMNFITFKQKQQERQYGL